MSAPYVVTIPCMLYDYQFGPDIRSGSPASSEYAWTPDCEQGVGSGCMIGAHPGSEEDANPSYLEFYNVLLPMGTYTVHTWANGFFNYRTGVIRIYVDGLLVATHDYQSQFSVEGLQRTTTGVQLIGDYHTVKWELDSDNIGRCAARAIQFVRTA